MVKCVVPLISAVFISFSVTAQGQAQVPTVPDPRRHHALTYDPVTKRVLLFGGVSAANAALRDLWSWDGEQWTRLSQYPDGGAPTKTFFADGKGGVFGVIDMTSTARTVRWNGEGWSTVTQDTAQRLALSTGAYDMRRDRYVTFGGGPRPRVVAGDTWEFAANTWTRVATVGPSPRMAAGMAYDEQRGVMLLFGGWNSTERHRFGDTWEWNGTQWRQVAASGPSARSDVGMFYDSRRGQVVMVGGVDSTGRRDDTWVWTGRAWRYVDGGDAPIRSEPFVAFDVSRGVGVMYAANNATGDQRPGETWEWDGNRWTLRVPRPR